MFSNTAINLEFEDIRKAQILQAALVKISEIGSFNITLDDIAKQAGMSKGGVAYYYKSKDILCKETFKEFFVRIFKRSKETVDKCSDPLSKLLSFGWLYNWNDPEVNLGYPMLMDAVAMAARDADYRKMFHEWVQSWVSILTEAVSEGISKGIFPEMDPEDTARTISSIYHGIAVRWYLDPENHTSEWAVAAFTQSITSLLKKG